MNAMKSAGNGVDRRVEGIGPAGRNDQPHKPFLFGPHDLEITLLRALTQQRLRLDRLGRDMEILSLQWIM